MRTLATALTFVAALALSGSALAADQLVAGKKLVIKNPPSGTANNKVVYLSKDPSINTPVGIVEDPRCAPDGSGIASLTVSSPDTAESFTIDLGGANCGNWTLNGAGNKYKYKDTSGATCKVVLIKDGKLVKAVCKGPQVAYDLGTATIDVDVVLRTGTNRYCSSFNAGLAGCTITKDGSDDKTYLAKNCAAGSVVCGASPSGAFLAAPSLF